MTRARILTIALSLACNIVFAGGAAHAASSSASMSVSVTVVSSCTTALSEQNLTNRTISTNCDQPTALAGTKHSSRAALGRHAAAQPYTYEVADSAGTPTVVY